MRRCMGIGVWIAFIQTVFLIIELNMLDRYIILFEIYSFVFRIELGPRFQNLLYSETYVYLAVNYRGSWWLSDLNMPWGNLILRI